MKIILTGATGFVGNEVLKQLLKDASIKQITLLVRRSAGITHPKLTEIILQDFLNYATITEHLHADACIWCLGISQTAVSKDEYITITFDYAMAAAKVMFAVNPQMRFCFLSGSRADQQEKSAILQRRIKGRTERELAKLSPHVFSFEPAFISRAYPGQKRPFIPALFEPIARVVNRFTDNFSVSAATLAHCLIDVAKHGAKQRVLDNRTIRYYDHQDHR